MGRPSRVPAPWGLLGMFALMAAVEGRLAHHALEFDPFYSHEWRVSDHAARRQATDSEILCFGDSLIKNGVSPRVMEHRLGRPTYNLAMSAGVPPASYLMLRRALAAGARPVAVLVDFKWTALGGSYASEYSMGGKLLPVLATPAECVDLGWTAKDSRFFAKLLVAKLFPSCRDRFEIRDNVRAALRGEGHPDKRELIRPWERNWWKNRGAHHAPKNPLYRGDIDPADTYLFPDAWAPDPGAVSYVERFLALAASRGITVFWLVMPVSPPLQARRDQVGSDAPYTRFARSMASRFPNLVVVDGRRAGYDRSVFLDHSHLDRQGAALLTEDVAAIVSRHVGAGARPDAPRWVELPAYRDRAIDVPLEDVSQSALALQKEGPTARR